MDWSDPVRVAALVGFTVVEAVALLAFLALVQAPPPEPANPVAPPTPPDGSPPRFRPPGASGSARRVGFIPRFGLVLGRVICFGVLLALTVVAALPGGGLLAVVGWWVTALLLFGLTVRQTFKANIAIGLVTIALLVSIGAVAG